MQDAHLTPFQEYIFRQLPFAPTEGQVPILASTKRFILVVGGEQAGKSMTAAKILLSRIPESPGPSLYWLVAADYDRTRREYEYLAADMGQLHLLAAATKRVDPGMITLKDGSRIVTKSAKDPRTLAMDAPDGIVVCEASQIDLETYWRLRARSAPRKAWMFMSGTFETSLGWYPSLAQAWTTGIGDEQSFRLPSYTNTYLYPQGLDDPEIQRLKRDASDDFFMERIEGIPCPPRGLVFPEFRAEVHLQPVTYDPEVDVCLWIDPGYAGAYAVEAVQEIDGQVRVIDEIYEQGLVTSEIIQLAQGKDWWKKVTGGAIDKAGTQHQGMPAPAEIWLKETGLYLKAQRIPVNDGTERLKSFLKLGPTNRLPRIVFSPRCKGVLSEFGVYPNPFTGQTRTYKWKTDREGNLVGSEPEDQNNHGLKAVIYGLVDKYGYTNAQVRRQISMKRWS